MSDPAAYPDITITPAKSRNTFKINNTNDEGGRQVSIVLSSSTSNKFELMLVTRNNSNYPSSYYKINQGAATNLSYIIPVAIDSFTIDICNNLITVTKNGQVFISLTVAGANLYSAFRVYGDSTGLMTDLVTANNATCVVSTPNTSTSTSASDNQKKKSIVWLIVLLAVIVPGVGIGAYYFMKQYKNKQIKQV